VQANQNKPVPAKAGTGVMSTPTNVIKLSRWLSEVEAVLPASAPLSQRFILPRGN